MTKCKKCKGTGEWERMDKNLVCPDCNGKGVVANEPLDPKEQAKPIDKEKEWDKNDPPHNGKYQVLVLWCDVPNEQRELVDEFKDGYWQQYSQFVISWKPLENTTAYEDLVIHNRKVESENEACAVLSLPKEKTEPKEQEGKICPACEGTGELPWDQGCNIVCNRCNGTGRIKEQEVKEEDDDIKAMDKKFSESAKKILDTATKNLIVVNKNLKSENEALRQSVRELNDSLGKIYNLIFEKDDEGHVVCFPDDMDFGSIRNELESAIERAKQHVK